MVLVTIELSFQQQAPTLGAVRNIGLHLMGGVIVQVVAGCKDMNNIGLGGNDTIGGQYLEGNTLTRKQHGHTRSL